MLAVQEIVIFYLIAGLLVLLIIVCCGCKLNRMTVPQTWMVALFGSFLFLFGIMPFYGEAKVIELIGKVEQDDVD